MQWRNLLRVKAEVPPGGEQKMSNYGLQGLRINDIDEYLLRLVDSGASGRIRIAEPETRRVRSTPGVR
jgi:hypothetical protein